MTKPRKLTHDEMYALIGEWFDEARDIDRNERKDEYAVDYCLSELSGIISVLMCDMYNRLKDEDYLVDFVPDTIKKHLDKIKNRDLMNKLESGIDG